MSVLITLGVILAIYVPLYTRIGTYWSRFIFAWFTIINLVLIYLGIAEPHTYPILAGVVMNGAVIWGNRGYMPVVGMTPGGEYGIWKKADSSDRWLWLADRMSLWGFSPGDFAIIAGWLLAMSL